MISFIPSPSQAVWYVGPLPLRAYALCIIAGALLAIWIGDRRFVKAGGRPPLRESSVAGGTSRLRGTGGAPTGFIGDMAIWAIPFGIVGARVYHVVTDPELYFGAGRNAVDALKIWQGGLGIWGAIAGGALGAWIACRRADVRFADVAGAVAPGLLVAQAVGRLGNYFNQELFGAPTTLPWALQIDVAHRPAGYAQYATFHPTFLYELIWNLAAAAVLVFVLERRFRLSGSQTFAAYVMLYTFGRLWIEFLRIDTANHLGPFRLNVWTSIMVFTCAAVYLVRSRRKGAGDHERHPRLDAPAS